MSRLGAALVQSPEYYLHSLDPVNEAAYLVRLSSAQYEAASFLDDRVLAPGMTGVWTGLDDIAADAAPLPENCDFIFHVGHVGSTLLSRLLGAFPGLHCLREPSPLPVLARMKTQLPRPESLWSQDRYEACLSLCLRLWSRTFEKGQTSVVKATSWASELAPQLLIRPSRPRAVCMTVDPQTYLVGVLGSQAAASDIRQSAPDALARLHRRLGLEPWKLYRMSAGQRAAMVWTCEMLCLDAAARSAPDQVMWIDFEAFLAAPAATLSATLTHLGQTVDPAQVDSVISGPLMTRYSKEPGRRFDPETRRTVMASSRIANREEVRKGLAWLDEAERNYPEVARMMATRTVHAAQTDLPA